MMRFAAPTAFMAQKKSIVDEAYPGDIVGIPDTGNFKIGDTLTPEKQYTSKASHLSLPKCSSISRTPTR